jgi:flagellar assembly protein FliH
MSLDAVVVVTVYEYPAIPAPASPAWDGVASLMPKADRRVEQEECAESVRPESRPHAPQDELQSRFDAGRKLGLEEGSRTERDAQASRIRADLERHQAQLAAVVHAFEKARDQYLEEVEHEVVKLALAIAARILRREAQMDPLLLTGAVRVALGQLSSLSQARLRVPSAEQDLWIDAMAHLPNVALKPEVIGDEAMRRGDCALETDLGTVDLGIRAQFSEIEHGFFDRFGREEGSTDTPGPNTAPEGDPR